MGCKANCTVILGFIFLCSNLTLAQTTYSISGSVLEAESEIPIPGAQVFLNGTTIGALSDNEGLFQLRNIPEGIFDLSVSLIGYKDASISINTSSLDAFYTFILTPEIYELDEVTVTPDLKEWKQNFEIFRKTFIGTGPFSDRTKIKNPEVLSFDFNPYERVLRANAYDKLIIENKSLGYQITYYLDFFEIDYRNSTSFYYGRPLFTELNSRRKRIRNRWGKNRELAYRGSFLHFKRALIEGSIESEGFISRGEKREEKARYISENTISKDIYFSQIDSSTYMLNFINFVNVTYEKEIEDETYLEFIWNPLSKNPRTLLQPQNSSFTLTSDSVLIDHSAYIFDPLSVILDGYWAFERVSDMIPLDYTPKK